MGSRSCYQTAEIAGYCHNVKGLILSGKCDIVVSSGFTSTPVIQPLKNKCCTPKHYTYMQLHGTYWLKQYCIEQFPNSE